MTDQPSRRVVAISTELHQEMKVFAAVNNMLMRDVVSEAIASYLKSHNQK